MTNILWIDTATETGTVGVIQNETILAWWEYKKEKSHARLTAQMIQTLIRDLEMTMSDLHAVAVSGGPGSYTGLRVGVSTAKGIAMALGIPLISLNSLENVALSILPFAQAANAWICPMIDARRMEVYCALYDENGVEMLPTEAKIITENAFEEVLSQRKLLFVGDGAAKCKDLFANHPNAIVLAEKVIVYDKIAQKLQHLYTQKQFEDLVDYEPFYLKSYVATVSTKNKLG